MSTESWTRTGSGLPVSTGWKGSGLPVRRTGSGLPVRRTGSGLPVRRTGREVAYL